MIWAIGNGQSRKTVNLNLLSGIKVGCNAIHRDFDVDHLICVDRRMVNEALSASVNSTVYTRKDWHENYPKSKKLKQVPPLPYIGNQRPDDPFHWGSGPYAVLLAAKLDETVHMIGFDLYSSNGKTNNIYKDTTHYNSSDKMAVDPRYWIWQISKVFKIYNRRNFVIYQEDDWIQPEAWKYPNVTVDKISNIYYNT